ncbi:hypothetical protein TNCT_657681 [Trichonephila clavata]|uniref:Uncharacterized protein n=1 Tax=Trichonephila clavata TaxID=2740835 RepID=A0A8X6HKU7_TRICU|nr:hypothetical protein TNCT_657681 [Trichonephila clavata]
MKMGQASRERDDQKTMKAKIWKRGRFKSRKSHIDYQTLGNSAFERRPCMEISILKGKPETRTQNRRSLTQREWGMILGTEGESVKFPPPLVTSVKTRMELDTCHPKRTLLM